MNRFKMSFNNAGYNPFQNNNNLAVNLAARPVVTAPKNISLNSPMIDRVYKAKSGCSACGKKVA